MLDLFVIGAGSGGVRAARIAAQHGAKVMIAEEDRVGGTCVIRGCVPKKFLVYASRFAHEFEDAKGYGFDVAKPSFDWSKLIAAKNTEIKRLEAIYERNLAGAGVELIRAKAGLHSPTSVKLSTGEVIESKRILIATGGEPARDTSILGIEHAITSNEAFDLKALPKRVLVVGGGYIALEFAGIFNGLGSKTTLLHRGDKVLRGFDSDVQNHIFQEYLQNGIEMRMNATITSITKMDCLEVALSTGETLQVDCVLLATGRTPNIQGLNLAQIGIHTGKNGAILVDALGKTNLESVFAIGDVTDRVNLTPVAIREGHAFADSLYGGKAWLPDHTLIPTAVFSEPEIGVVGLTQQQAVLSHSLDIYKTAFKPMKHALSGRNTKMFMKLIVDSNTQKVLGAHIVGEGAGEMIQLLGIAIKMGATKQDFDNTMAVHPTASEELVTMRSITEKITQSI